MGAGTVAMYEISLVFALGAFLAVVVAYARTPSCNVYHPFLYYCLFHGLIFVFRPIVAYFSDFSLIYQVYQFNPSYEDKVTVIFASTFGFLSFGFFCLKTGGGEMVFKNDRALHIERDLISKILIWVVVILSPLGIYSLVSRYDRISDGQSTMVIDQANGVFVNTVSNGYLTDSQIMLATLGVMIAWIFRFHVLSLLPMVIFILVRAGTGGRGLFITAGISLGLLWLYQQQKKFFNVAILVALVALVAAFNQVGSDRGAAIRSLVTGEDVVQAENKEKWLEGMDFGNMEYFEFLVYAVPQRTNEYGYFVNNLQLFTEPVPRVWWPNKPAGAPFSKIALFDYGYPIGMTRSLPGEGWYNLGWIGVIAWCGLWGAGLGWLYRRWVDSDQSTLKTLAYLLFLPSLVVSYRDGTLLTAAKQNFWFLGPIVLAAVLASWFGVPKLAEIRKQLQAQRRQQSSPAAAPGAPPDRVQPSAVPPAVLRRRAALAALRAPTKPE